MFSVNFVYNLDNFKITTLFIVYFKCSGYCCNLKKMVLLILYSHRSMVIPRLLWCYITYSHDDWCKRWQYVVIWVDVFSDKRHSLSVFAINPCRLSSSCVSLYIIPPQSGMVIYNRYFLMHILLLNLHLCLLADETYNSRIN